MDIWIWPNWITSSFLKHTLCFSVCTHCGHNPSCIKKKKNTRTHTHTQMFSSLPGLVIIIPVRNNIAHLALCLSFKITSHLWPCIISFCITSLLIYSTVGWQQLYLQVFCTLCNDFWQCRKCDRYFPLIFCFLVIKNWVNRKIVGEHKDV